MLHNISRRKLVFLAAGPFIADAMAMLIVCAVIVQANRMGVSSFGKGCLGAAYSVAYAFTAHYAGRWVKPRIAMMVLTIALPVSAIFPLGTLITSYWALMATAVLSGIAIGHYFTPFQLKMGNVKPFTTLAWTVGFYNICWSLGYAGGAFAGSFLRSLPDPTWLILAAGALAAIHTAVSLVAHYDRTPDNPEYHSSEAFQSTSRQRWSGWLAILVGMFLLNSAMYTLWPALTQKYQLSDVQLAFGMLILASPIPLGSFLWPRLRRIVASGPWLIVALLVTMAAGYLLLPLCPWPMAMVPLALTGLGAGGLFFHTVYYSNGDAERPGHSIGMNELMVGLGGVVGPPIMGALAGTDEQTHLPYYCGAGLALALAVALITIWGRTAGASGQGAASPSLLK